MKFSVGGLFSRKQEPAGPRVVGRTELGGEFLIGQNESFVVGDTVLTNAGMYGGKLALDIRVADRSGRIELHVNEPTKGGSSWFEYRISPVVLDQAMRAKLSVKKACDRAKPVIYDADFWLKAGEFAAFEHGLVVRNKSTSRSRQGEFTNVTLEMEYQGQKKEVTLVSFAKGKEKFVYAQMKNTGSFGPFDIKLNSASESEAVLSVHKGNELML